MLKSSSLWALPMLVSAMLFVAPVFSQTAASKPQAQKQQATAQKAVPRTAAGGMVAAKDPGTGQLRQATQEEIKALEMQSRSVQDASRRTQAGAVARPGVAARDEAAATIQGPGNAIGMTVDESLHTYAVATRTADGKITMGCVTGPKEAAKAVQKGTVPKTSQKEHSDEK